MSRGGCDMEDSGVGDWAGEMEECMLGVRVVAILSCKFDGILIFFGFSLGI